MSDPVISSWLLGLLKETELTNTYQALKEVDAKRVIPRERFVAAYPQFTTYVSYERRDGCKNG